MSTDHLDVHRGQNIISPVDIAVRGLRALGGETGPFACGKTTAKPSTTTTFTNGAPRDIACIRSFGCCRIYHTQVRFHPHKRSFMLTGSEDGLMCFFDTEVSLEEDVSSLLWCTLLTPQSLIELVVAQSGAKLSSHPRQIETTMQASALP